MNFGNEGHVCISPKEFEERLLDVQYGEQRLVNDILLPGTPARFDTHKEYCDFLHLVADKIGVHPSSVVVCGSVKLGFSTSPRSGKIWCKWQKRSDIDLAIVDPDHYQLLDTEFRRWERLVTPAEDKELKSKRHNLRWNRSNYCHRHSDMPNTPAAERYKEAIATVQRTLDHDDITAYFYRDWWSFSARREYDLRTLRLRINSDYLLRAGDAPRPRLHLTDEDLRRSSDVDCKELCLSSMDDITDNGLEELKRFGKLERVWLDDMASITGNGLAALCTLPELNWLSICTFSDQVQVEHFYVLRRLPNLKTLFVEGQSMKEDKQLKELREQLPGVTICKR